MHSIGGERRVEEDCAAELAAQQGADDAAALGQRQWDGKLVRELTDQEACGCPGWTANAEIARGDAGDEGAQQLGVSIADNRGLYRVGRRDGAILWVHSTSFLWRSHPRRRAALP
jgi:hypothetical protein